MQSTKKFGVAALGAVVALGAVACSGGRSDNTSSGGGSGGTTGGTTPSGEAAFAIDTANCTDYQPTAGVTDDTITFGTSGPTSGVYGTAFAPIRKGYQAYFDYINAEKNGVKDHKIEIVGLDKDDKYDPNETKRIVGELVDEEVFGFFNVLGTANNLAVRDDLNEGCIPNLFVATGAVEWGETDEYPWTIGSLPSYATEAAVFAQYLKDNKPDATVTIIAQNDDFGNGYANAFKKAIEGTDITVVEEATYNAGESDVTAQMTSLGATNSDALLVAATALACPNALKAVETNASWDPITYVSVTCAIKTLIDIGGPGAFADTLTVAYLVNPLDPASQETEGIKEFNEKGALYGLSPEDLTNSTVQYGWFAGDLLARTLEQAPELTRQSVMETAYALDFTTDMALPGAVVKTTGPDDPFPLESLYIAKFNGEYFSPEGEVIDFEGKTVDFLP
ncbi:MAG: ABC transporter substrate-binding protein [Acidimicrobiales bacterium]|nr:ABC transporter substrate-binding protein [Acidimicrobiales bacterium]MCB1249168.1 ABC transporter substrate-binding protein [Acidimicrobiales bacterium]MCB1260951.1 ABC transporter substrate-binding protein [Acidimicrobiales bacterium]